MIKINLLPVKEEKLINEAKGFLLIVAVSLGFVIVLAVLNSTMLVEQEDESRKRIAEADKEIANLKTIMGEIKSLKVKKAKLQEKMDMIIKLQEQNVGPVRILDELSLKIPSNKIWLDDISLSGNRIALTGKTLENQEVANFMKQLENSLFFSNINLKKVTKDKSVKGIPMLSFSMNTNVHSTGRKKVVAEKKQPEPAVQEKKK